MTLAGDGQKHYTKVRVVRDRVTVTVTVTVVRVRVTVTVVC